MAEHRDDRKSAWVDRGCGHLPPPRRVSTSPRSYARIGGPTYHAVSNTAFEERRIRPAPTRRYNGSTPRFCAVTRGFTCPRPSHAAVEVWEGDGIVVASIRRHTWGGRFLAKAHVLARKMHQRSWPPWPAG